MILGVDPGLSGAIAKYDMHTNDCEVFDVPTLNVSKSGRDKRGDPKTQRILDIYQLARVVSGLKDNIHFCVVEDVHSMPKQGVASSFKFGFVAGALQQALADAGITIHLVAPVQWKRYFKLGKAKDDARRKASMLMPGSAWQWPKTVHDGRAEAALLAYWGGKTAWDHG